MKWHHVQDDDSLETDCGRPRLDVLITEDWGKVDCLQCQATRHGRGKNAKREKNSLDAQPGVV